MSANDVQNQPPKLTLGEYITTLIGVLGSADPTALVRMRQIVDERHAHIVLDKEALSIWFADIGLNVLSTAKADVNGIGETDSSTVLALLDGYIEVIDAILSGRLRVTGSPEDINRIFLAIEILLDASSRTPALQELTRQFAHERHDQRSSSMPERLGMSWYPFAVEEGEQALLKRLGLLP